MTEQTQPNRPTWQSEAEYPELVETFIKAMREIVDPEIGLDIIQLGLIRDLYIEDKMAVLTMILTTPFCPYGPAMIETTREKAEEALARPVSITFGNEVWDFSMMEEGATPDWGLY
jgi:metal-sulfur cluster biosynthetic enzyme